MAQFEIVYRLPLPRAPKLHFGSNYELRGAELIFEGRTILRTGEPEELHRGKSVRLPGTNRTIHIKAERADSIEVLLDDELVLREDQFRAPTSRSAWIHAWVALSGSMFGLIASYLYLVRSETSADPWAMKMSLHMAAWHLLLTLTLFPASVWGQRAGIRSVQVVSLLFFLIHLGISLANTGYSITASEGPWIATLNALSGLSFFVAVVYGQRAYRDMDPLRGSHWEAFAGAEPSLGESGGLGAKDPA